MFQSTDALSKAREDRALSSLVDSEIYKTVPIQFPRRFSLFHEKNSILHYCLFSLNVWEATRKARALQVASAYRRQEFWRETHTPLWLLIGRTIFLTPPEKALFAIVIGLFFFFSRVKNIVRSSDWLELICVWRFVISFQWVYLSMYTLYRGDLTLCNKNRYMWSFAPSPPYPTFFFASF